MKKLTHFWTFTCERCGREESTEAVTTYVAALPPDWGNVADLDFCPNCKAVVAAALQP